MKSLIALSSVLILMSFNSLANTSEPPHNPEYLNYLTVVSVKTIDLTDEYGEITTETTSNTEDPTEIKNFDLTPVDTALDAINLIVDKIINIGEKIWGVVEKGRPATNYANTKASALPANATNWDQLENWQAPRSKVVQVVHKNVYGMEVVKFTYRIILLYGGSVKGVGKYIGYAAVEPVEMSSVYMYSFDAKAEVDAVYNQGTSKNPIAGMVLNVKWTVESLLKKSTLTHSYTLDGLGNIAAMN
ncbi:MAG: hypothetical protein AABY53_05275 [Bdellovibrionota bacterium]